MVFETQINTELSQIKFEFCDNLCFILSWFDLFLQYFYYRIKQASIF